MLILDNVLSNSRCSNKCLKTLEIFGENLKDSITRCVKQTIFMYQGRNHQYQIGSSSSRQSRCSSGHDDRLFKNDGAARISRRAHFNAFCPSVRSVVVNENVGSRGIDPTADDVHQVAEGDDGRVVHVVGKAGHWDPNVALHVVVPASVGVNFKRKQSEELFKPLCASF